MKGLRRKNVNPTAAEIQLLKAGQEDAEDSASDDDAEARIERAKSKVGLPSVSCEYSSFVFYCFLFCTDLEQRSHAR